MNGKTVIIYFQVHRHNDYRHDRLHFRWNTHYCRSNERGTLLVENYENGDGKKQFNEYTLGRPCGDEWLKYLNDYEDAYSWTVTDKLHPEEYLDDF